MHRFFDLIYYDDKDIAGKKEKESEAVLNKKIPNFKWEVVNQARAHLFSKSRPKARSSCEALSYWVETPTCVGVRLEKDNSFTICAPHGLKDLFALIVRPSPHHSTNLEHYKKRVKEKNWEKQWPKLKIIFPIKKSMHHRTLKGAV